MSSISESHGATACEHSHCSKNQKLGEYEVKVPPGPAGKEQIELRYTYDLNGILEVEATVQSTQKKSVLVIERSPGRLTPEQTAVAKAAMQRLKFHPRDALPNTTALNRAEALYLELKGEERQTLAGAIAQFRGTLETQEPTLIFEARDRLVRLVDILRAQSRRD